MNRIRAFSFVLFVIAGVLPSLVKAQAVPQEAERVSVRDTRTLVNPSSARLLSLGVVPQELAVGRWRGWPQAPQRKNQPMPAAFLLDSIISSAPECPMPVARLAPEAISPMPVAALDTTRTTPGVVKRSGCINPLDRRP